jgi:hypothetical protein
LCSFKIKIIPIYLYTPHFREFQIQLNQSFWVVYIISCVGVVGFSTDIILKIKENQIFNFPWLQKINSPSPRINNYYFRNCFFSIGALI